MMAGGRRRTRDEQARGQAPRRVNTVAASGQAMMEPDTKYRKKERDSVLREKKRLCGGGRGPTVGDRDEI